MLKIKNNTKFIQVDQKLYHFETDHGIDSMDHFLICKDEKEAKQFALEQQFCDATELEELFGGWVIPKNKKSYSVKVKNMSRFDIMYKSLWKKKK